MRTRVIVSSFFLAGLLAASAALADSVQWAGIGPPGRGEVHFIAATPAAPGLVYVVAVATVWKTSDGGTTWSAISFGLPTSPVVTALAIDPASPGTVYAGTTDVGIPEPPTPGNVYKSTDGGISWTRLANFPSRAVADLKIVNVPGHLVFAATSEGIYCSPDGGANWILVGADGDSISSLAFSPSSPNVAYAGGRAGIYKSTNGGNSWVSVAINFAIRFVYSVAVDPANANVAYAAAGFIGCPSPCGVPPEPGAARTIDGVTWTIFGIDLPPFPHLAAVIVRSDSTALAGTFGAGVYSSANHGVNWTLASTGLGDLTVATLASDGSTVYAGTSDGLFKTTSSESCSSGTTALCLNQGRFRVDVAWRSTNVGGSGSGQAMPLTADTGAFWFFQPSNIELVVKVLDGRTVNGKFWIFFGALSNVEYTITVTDTATGAVKTYFNSEGNLASVADTDAF